MEKRSLKRRILIFSRYLACLYILFTGMGTRVLFWVKLQAMCRHPFSFIYEDIYNAQATQLSATDVMMYLNRLVLSRFFTEISEVPYWSKELLQSTSFFQDRMSHSTEENCPETMHTKLSLLWVYTQSQGQDLSSKNKILSKIKQIVTREVSVLNEYIF